jgi:hypothetical protein
MFLVSVDIVVAEDSDVEDWLLSSAHPAREASAKAARQEKINVEGRMEVLVVFINVRIRRGPISPMGCIPHDACAVFSCKHQVMKTDSKKRSLRLGKFIARVYDVYFPGDHGHYGTDADHVPVIPGNDFLKIEVDVRVKEIIAARQPPFRPILQQTQSICETA